MLEANDIITLEDIFNECGNFDTKCDSDMYQQESGEHYYVNRNSSESVPERFHSL